jgi:hypothetical protein
MAIGVLAATVHGEDGRIRAARRRPEAVAEARENTLRGDVVGVDVEATLRLHPERAKIVDAVEMVGMGMGVENAVEIIDTGAELRHMSGLVSTSTRVGVRPSVRRSISSAQRERRFRGSLGSQEPQSLPIRGTPGDGPQPRIVAERSVIPAARF